MLVQCPACGVRLRFSQAAGENRLVTLSCPRCQGKFKILASGVPSFHALIAHEDQEVCRQLLSRLGRLPVFSCVCRHPREVIEQLDKGTPCLLLLDVAFAGGFPFELIDQAKQQGAGKNKIILLPSIYNKTAYKRQPTSLYGADKYLELHHIGDCLVPMVVELFPQLEGKIVDREEPEMVGGERNLTQPDLNERTLALCRLLMADIVLYHQERLLPGMQKQEARQAFADCLEVGRQLLFQRLPEAERLSEDYLLQAFDEFYDSYLHHQQGS